MERAGTKTRDIQFFSRKNNGMVCVHTHWARDYAKYLEEQPWVEAYEAGRPLDRERCAHVNPVDIRRTYFQTEWVSDFYLRYADGRSGIRELITAGALKKLAVIEKLELSRRYWAALDIDEWKVILIQEVAP